MMTPESTLRTAAAALRREPEPTWLYTVLARWLEDTAKQVECADLTESEYRFPLAVARAVLEERGRS